MSDNGFPLDSEGVWCEILTAPATSRPALFLDRDGVVLEDVNYLARPENVRFLPGATSVIAAANAHNIAVILITNQSGIGRGYYGWSDFRDVQNQVIKMLAAVDAHIDAVFACAHHAEGKGKFAHPDHPARKPNPGMLLRAGAALPIEMKHSWLVGDRLIDLQAARDAGIAGSLHVLTGYGRSERNQVTKWAAGQVFDVRLGSSIADALRLPALAS